MLENKLGITNEIELSKEEERITKLKALELFDTNKINEFDISINKIVDEMRMKKSRLNFLIETEKEKEEKAASRFLVFHKASDFSDGTDTWWIMLLLLWRLCRQGGEASLRGSRARAEI